MQKNYLTSLQQYQFNKKVLDKNYSKISNCN